MSKEAELFIFVKKTNGAEENELRNYLLNQKILHFESVGQIWSSTQIDMPSYMEYRDGHLHEINKSVVSKFCNRKYIAFYVEVANAKQS